MSDTSNQARVSVLISTFNRGDMLEESLDSVLNQTLAPHQVIVIDDGSTDDTAERIKKYSSSRSVHSKGATAVKRARLTPECRWLRASLYGSSMTTTLPCRPLLPTVLPCLQR